MMAAVTLSLSLSYASSRRRTFARSLARSLVWRGAAPIARVSERRLDGGRPHAARMPKRTDGGSGGGGGAQIASFVENEQLDNDDGDETCDCRLAYRSPVAIAS